MASTMVAARRRSRFERQEELPTSLFDAGDSVAWEAGGEGKEFLDVAVGDEGDTVLSVIGGDGCVWDTNCFRQCY